MIIRTVFYYDTNHSPAFIIVLRDIFKNLSLRSGSARETAKDRTMISDHSWQLIRPEPLYNLFSISPKLPSKRHFSLPVIINVYRFKYYKYKTALKCDFPYLHTYPSIYSLHTSIILIVLHTMPMHKHLIWVNLNLQRDIKRT